MTKQCTRCRETKGIDLFGRNGGRLSSWCRACGAANARQWRKDHPERVVELNRRWAKDNPEKVAESFKRWKEGHPGAALLHGQNWRRNNSERAAENDRAKWERNPELYGNIRRTNKHRRRALEKLAPGDGVTAAQWTVICQDFNGMCAYCNETIAGSIHMEHMDPISRGGAHDITNVVPSCGSCNMRKGKLTALEFLVGIRL